MKVGRNAPCPCGSGRKFKKCCGTVEKTETVPPMPDRRAMEKTMADLGRHLEGKDFESAEEANFYLQNMVRQPGGHIPALGPTTDIERAQDLMYEAWETGGSKALALAKKALEISPDCADAYVLLAENGRNADEMMDLYQKGVEAGERTLGKKTFEEDAGHFWGLIETRPYMRARTGLAQCLWAKGQREEGIEHYFEMLRLNAGDNQGLRYVLLGCLLEIDDPQRLERLFQKFPDDGAAAWLYGQALHIFRKDGDAPKARKLLQEAKEMNKHVPKYLLGKKPIPKQLPAMIGFGDESEAVACASDQIEAWEATPGALKWLAK